MKNLHPVYTCQDYNINDDSILVIENPILLGMVENESQFNQLVEDTSYNAIICPALYSDNNEVGTFKYVKFSY
jgi:hypothetical protein